MNNKGDNSRPKWYLMCELPKLSVSPIRWKIKSGMLSIPRIIFAFAASFAVGEIDLHVDVFIVLGRWFSFWRSCNCADFCEWELFRTSWQRTALRRFSDNDRRLRLDRQRELDQWRLSLTQLSALEPSESLLIEICMPQCHPPALSVQCSGGGRGNYLCFARSIWRFRSFEVFAVAGFRKLENETHQG